SSRRRHTRFSRDWSSDVCSSDLADQSADVSALGDARDREGEDEVDDDDPERAAAEDVVALPLEHEAGAEDPENRSGRADGRDERSEERRVGKGGGARGHTLWRVE